jgi:hypothetical protein
MPYASESQRRLMQGIAHGWKPDMKNAPSKSVAQKFERDSRKSKLSQLLKVGK